MNFVRRQPNNIAQPDFLDWSADTLLGLSRSSARGAMVLSQKADLSAAAAIKRAAFPQTKLRLRRRRQRVMPTAPSASPPSELSSGMTVPEELVWPVLMGSPGSAQA